MAEVFGNNLRTGLTVALRRLTPNLLRFLLDLLRAADWVLLPVIEGNPAIHQRALPSASPTAFPRSFAARPRSWERSSQATTMLGRGIVTRSLARVVDPKIMGETGIRSSSTPLDYFLVRADLGSF